MQRLSAFCLVGLAFLTVPVWAADSKAEIDFVTRAADANLAAVAESKVALARASDGPLTDYARALIPAHEQAETDLQAAAEGSGAAIPPALDTDHQGRLGRLKTTALPDFEKAYVADQAEIHSNALTLYADYMLLGDNAKLKAFAVKMIPITEAQFKRAQALSSR